MSPSQKKPPSRTTPKQHRPRQLGQSNTKPWVRVVVVLIVIALALGSVGILLFNGDDSSDSSDVTADSRSSTTQSTVAALASAAGKPCVALADPLPAGAPEVPVTVGPPPTTLVSTDIQPGTGATVEGTSTITVDYIGVSCSTGKIFDASYGQQPPTFALNQVIPGWQQGLLGMQVGGTRLLAIPPDLAYGDEGRPGIAPDETLWFVVQVKDVQAGTTPAS